MGGSFNPAHEGHAAVAQTALKRLRLDRVWWLVSPGNPLKQHDELWDLGARAEAAQRLAPGRRVVVTTFEAGLGTSYSVDVVRFLRSRYRGVRFVWVMGADNLAQFHRWRSWRQIANLVPIAVVDRPGWRLRSLAAPAARALVSRRVPERLAPCLAAGHPPAWTLLTTRLSPQSSTALRWRRTAATGPENPPPAG